MQKRKSKSPAKVSRKPKSPRKAKSPAKVSRKPKSPRKAKSPAKVKRSKSPLDLRNSIKKKVGGYNNNIQENDILMKFNNAWVLKPGVKKGVLIRHSFIGSELYDDIIRDGIKSSKRLRNEGKTDKIPFPFVFFRAPTNFTGVINYDDIDKEIKSLYDDPYGSNGDPESHIYIRVDPANTYVFSSEIRDSNKPDSIGASKIPLANYLKTIIDNNQKIKDAIQRGIKGTPYYDKYNYEYKHLQEDYVHNEMDTFDMDIGGMNTFRSFQANSNLTSIDPTRNAEVLLETDIVPREYFVYAKKSIR